MKFFITIICHFLVQSKYIFTDRQQQDIIFIQKRNETLIV